MDAAPYTINDNASIQRCYRFFRTMGLRHLIVLDGDHHVIGMITRKDITEHRLSHHWNREVFTNHIFFIHCVYLFSQGVNMQRFINMEPLEPGLISENAGLLDDTSQHEYETSTTINEKDMFVGAAELQERENDKDKVGFELPKFPLSPPRMDDLPPVENLPSAQLVRSNSRQQQKQLKEPKSIRK
jgi:hypothetical protein